jgi:hypothetical protein
MLIVLFVYHDSAYAEYNLKESIDDEQPMWHAIHNEAQYAPGSKSQHKNCAAHKRRSGHLLIEGPPKPDYDHSQIEAHHGPHDVREIGCIDCNPEEGVETS